MKFNSIQAKTLKALRNKLESGAYKQVGRVCVVCGVDDFELLAETDRWGLPVSTVICRKCGLVQTNPCMTEQSFRDFYRNEYRELYYGSKFSTDAFFCSQVERGKYIRNFLRYVNLETNISKDCFVLDVGTGAGGVLFPFKRAGNKVVGVDYGEDYLEYGRMKGLDLREGTIHDVNLDKQPELIIYSQVFEHIVDPGKELIRIRSILRDDGFLFIGLPGIRNIHLAYCGDLLRYLQIAHVHHFSLVTLDNLLGKYGFERVIGNKIIWSLYKKCNEEHVLINDYYSTKAYLRIIKRFKYLYHPYSNFVWAGNIFLSFLARLLRGSLFDAAARKIYKKFKFGE